MKAVTYQGPDTVRVEEVPEPRIQAPTDAIVRAEVAGLCGSDLHILHGDTGGVEPGTIIGHELVGRVEAVGDAVSGVQEGDRVVASFQIPCGECGPCRREAYHGCPELLIFGHGLAYGSLAGLQAERARVPFADRALWRVPEAVSSEEAVFASDILTAAYTGVRPWIAQGHPVAVVGAGPVGLLALEVADALGASGTFAVDIDPERAQIARERGHHAPDPEQTDAVARVLDAVDGEGAPLVIEAVGREGEALEAAFELTAPGGATVALGVPTAFAFEYPWLQAFTKGTTFHATLANVPRWIEEVLALQAKGRLEASWLVSDRVPLREAEAAYERFDNRETLKVLFTEF